MSVTLKNKYRNRLITFRSDHYSRHPRIGHVNLAVGTLARVEPMRTHCRQMSAAYSDYTVRSLDGSSVINRVRDWKRQKKTHIRFV